MDIGFGSTLLAGDPRLVDHIVGEVKSQGIFDQFRKECIADVDTKPAYQNLRSRVEGSVNTFLSKQIWKPDMNKNQLRENLRKHIHDAAYLDAGVERIVDQVVNPKVYSIFMPQIEDVVYKFLGMERPKGRDRNGTAELTDLLPKDLDPVSPESDKNSLKDISLESTDAALDGKSSTNNGTVTQSMNKSESDSHMNDNKDEKPFKDIHAMSRLVESTEIQLEMEQRLSATHTSTTNLNVSTKSDDKVEEEEEDSPTFEPIDIMNLNESNDSHLSGISELTSHRSRSPDFLNEFSRDNLDFSNQDSQLSKVSSDSRLSIVTDFGSSNHASTTMPDVLHEESNKGKSTDFLGSKNNKDNFKAIRDIQSNKGSLKDTKNAPIAVENKDNTQEIKDSKDITSSKVTSDVTDSGLKEKHDPRDSRDKNKDTDSNKVKSHRDKTDSKEIKSKDKDKVYRKRHRSHSSSKHDKSDKHSRDKVKERSEKSRDSSDKHKDISEKHKEAEKSKEDKKDVDKSDNIGKDLKDIYKEKIRELREKKELTEKEKLGRDNKDVKSNKESKEKKESSRDRKDSKSSSVKSSSRHEEKSNKSDEKSASKNDSRTSSRSADGKDSKSESKDKGKRDDKRHSKDSKDSRSKNHTSTKSDTVEKADKSESKKEMKSKDCESLERSDTRKDHKPESQKSETRKDAKTETQSDPKKEKARTDSHNKDRKKKDDKKSKSKDDHFSMRKHTNDRRSTDRDGSNGSNSKNSQNSSSNSSSNSNKTSTSSKDSSGTSNSSSETSDTVEDSPSDGMRIPSETLDRNNETQSTGKHPWDKYNNVSESLVTFDLCPKKVDLGQAEFSLPLKKRPLHSDPAAPNPDDFKVKKPKFAKNFQEAKRLMKLRKKLEKQRLQEYQAAKEKFQLANNENKPDSHALDNQEDGVPVLPPDEERVQIIEIADDEYEEPYPDLSMKQLSMTLEERSLTSLQHSLGLNAQDGSLEVPLKQSDYSEMEESIKRSLADVISDTNLIPTKKSATSMDDAARSITTRQNEETDAHEKASNGRDDEEIKSPNVTDGVNDSDDSLRKSQPEVDETTNGTCPRPSLDATESMKSDSPCNIDYDKREATNEVIGSQKSEDSDCMYFEVDDQRSLKFAKYLQSLESETPGVEQCLPNSLDSLEKILESLGGQIVSSFPKTMAPPMPKRKLSTSPLSDIVLNNSNNNNIRQKILQIHSPQVHSPQEHSPLEDGSSLMKKRKIGRPKKQQQQQPQQRAIGNVCAIQNLPNGENFVMPLSPESDVSASSEKTPMHPLKEERNRQRKSQRYSSDDLYKPRPFFSSSSRRSRRTDQA